MKLRCRSARSSSLCEITHQEFSSIVLSTAQEASLYASTDSWSTFPSESICSKSAKTKPASGWRSSAVTADESLLASTDRQRREMQRRALVQEGCRHCVGALVRR